MIFNNFSRKHFLILIGLSIAVIAVILIFVFWNLKSAGTTKWLRNSNCPELPVDVRNSTLELVHILFRHGPRTPTDKYANDPYINNTFYPTGWGHLTNSGKQELFEMGEWLKIRYASFLNSYYFPELIHAQSTASPRTMMSLATVLASMFPPKNTPMEWNPNYNWQPIPIVSLPLEEDNLLVTLAPCPRYFELLDEVFALPEIKAELDQFAELFENLTEITGTPMETPDDVYVLYVTLEAEKAFGLTLPEWTKDYFPEKMRLVAERSLIYNSYTREQQKIKGGTFVKKMLQEMEDKQSNTLQPKERKMFIYAAHDWSMGHILSALNVWKQQLPHFSIMAIFELHKDKESGTYFVKAFLKNGINACLTPLNIPNCGENCELDKLIELSSDVIPNDTFEERCRSKNL